MPPKTSPTVTRITSLKENLQAFVRAILPSGMKLQPWQTEILPHLQKPAIATDLFNTDAYTRDIYQVTALAPRAMAVRACLGCGGTGVIRNGEDSCGRCGGTGVIRA